MPTTVDTRDPATGEVVTLGPLCGVGYGSTYARICLHGDIPLHIGGGGCGTSKPHHRLHGEISTWFPVIGGGGSMYAHGNLSIRVTVPLSLYLQGEGEMVSKAGPNPMVSNTVDAGLTLGVCADITTLSPVRVYCNDLSPLVPTLSNHLPEVEGYQNACPTQCWEGMPGDGSRYYPHEVGSEPPPSIWQGLQGVELRILQETPITSPYGYHQVWLLADLWYKGQQVAYLRNGTGAQAPSRHILNRGALNALVVYLTKALGMNQNVYAAPPPATNLSTDIGLVKHWGMRYTHGRP